MTDPFRAEKEIATSGILLKLLPLIGRQRSFPKMLIFAVRSSVATPSFRYTIGKITIISFYHLTRNLTSIRSILASCQKSGDATTTPLDILCDDEYHWMSAGYFMPQERVSKVNRLIIIPAIWWQYIGCNIKGRRRRRQMVLFTQRRGNE